MKIEDIKFGVNYFYCGTVMTLERISQKRESCCYIFKEIGKEKPIVIGCYPYQGEIDGLVPCNDKNIEKEYNIVLNKSDLKLISEALTNYINEENKELIGKLTEKLVV